jgi:hypothetical protein
LSAIDQPQDGIDLKEFKIGYSDGLKDNFMAGQKDEPWTGGMV